MQSAISGIDISSKCFMTKIERWRGDSDSMAAPRRSRISRPAARRSGEGAGCAAVSCGRSSSSSSRAWGLMKVEDEPPAFQAVRHQFTQIRVSQVSKVDPCAEVVRGSVGPQEALLGGESASPMSRSNR